MTDQNVLERLRKFVNDPEAQLLGFDILELSKSDMEALLAVVEAAQEDHLFHINGKRLMADMTLGDCPGCIALARLNARTD